MAILEQIQACISEKQDCFAHTTRLLCPHNKTVLPANKIGLLTQQDCFARKQDQFAHTTRLLCPQTRSVCPHNKTALPANKTGLPTRQDCFARKQDRFAHTTRLLRLQTRPVCPHSRRGCRCSRKVCPRSRRGCWNSRQDGRHTGMVWPVFPAGLRTDPDGLARVPGGFGCGSRRLWSGAAEISILVPKLPTRGGMNWFYAGKYQIYSDAGPPT